MYQEMPPLPVRSGIEEKKEMIKKNIWHYKVVDTVITTSTSIELLPKDFDFFNDKNARIAYQSKVIPRGSNQPTNIKESNITEVKLFFTDGYYNIDKNKFIITMHQFRSSKDAAGVVFFGELKNDRWQWQSKPLYTS